MVNTYTQERKQEIIGEVQAGSAVTTVATATGVHEKTIRKWLAAANEGKSLASSRPGPKPFFPPVAEQQLCDWVIGRRFKERFPVLTRRTAQALSLKRNCIVPTDLTMLFNTLAKLVIELKLDASRVFNMDETAFQKQLKSKKVVAVKGSSNVWSTEPTANFHLTIVACGSAAGFVVPPAFILPGKTVSSRLLENCEAPGAAVSSSPSGFMNTELFEYSYHQTEAPPAPLDVAVFSTLRNKIRNLIGELVEEEDSGFYSISKEDAIVVAGMAWRGAKISRNIKRGFKACGLYPLSLVKMGSRLDAFARNGAPRHVQLAAWLHMREIVQDEALTLPAPPPKDISTKRKRVSVGGRLLTHAVLQAGMPKI
ncbi:hypothetical protein PHYSODRAFT_334665 [Phytophthora sojae]|uniref:DDE-1 domain-containing protein n=1 Tax=Phytophthora sojae (strain P6497) TaxID=1094619 RepID=G4ZSU0_PHYSP|nr:hypothetical protein PHYSODRAFT_334665 [Phytophthora sojae]EGZ12811.1 hypothetical protein PHYSODRAFT_334665 [Phytophthora sojae]|eukprot:XP_009530240.1 hypothetical protein PHYSODRAFT_334665 [Phytophthora sojae]